MEIYFFIVLEDGSPRSRYQPVWFLLRSHSLAYKWLPSCCVLTWFFFCAHGAPGVCVQISFSFKDTSQIGLGLTLVTSFKFNSPFKGLSSQYSNILRYWHLGFNKWILGDTIQPITMPFAPFFFQLILYFTVEFLIYPRHQFFVLACRYFLPVYHLVFSASIGSFSWHKFKV